MSPYVILFSCFFDPTILVGVEIRLSLEEPSRAVSFMESTRLTLPSVGHSTLVGDG
jgi:hypothetical protein